MGRASPPAQQTMLCHHPTIKCDWLLSLKSLHISHKLIPTIKFVEKHTKAGKTRREKHDITRPSQSNGSLHGLVEMREHASYRIFFSLPPSFFLHDWKQFFSARTSQQNYISTTPHYRLRPSFQRQVLRIATSNQYNISFKCFNAHPSCNWRGAGTVIDEANTINDAHLLQTMSNTVKMPHRLVNNLVGNS